MIFHQCDHVDEDDHDHDDDEGDNDDDDPQHPCKSHYALLNSFVREDPTVWWVLLVCRIMTAQI